MKAVVYTKYGTPDVLRPESVPRPSPGKGKVLVKIVAASVNSWDWDLLRGKPFLVKLLGGLSRPRHKVLGADIAGVVEAVGIGANDFQPGDQVYGDIAGAGFGGFAEYAVVPEKLLAKKSPQMSFEQAAALPQAGLLALQGLRYKKPLERDQELLINGAGGGVGTIAVQYARSIGAKVTCVDKQEKFELLRSLGAGHLIDYTLEDYTRNGKQYDYILDVIAHRSVADYKRSLKPGGVFAMIGGSMGGLLVQMMLIQPLLSRFRGKKLGIMGYRVNREGLDELTRLFEEKIIIPVIDRSFPLDETADAFRYFGKGDVKGKIIIRVSP